MHIVTIAKEKIFRYQIADYKPTCRAIVVRWAKGIEKRKGEVEIEERLSQEIRAHYQVSVLGNEVEDVAEAQEGTARHNNSLCSSC